MLAGCAVLEIMSDIFGVARRSDISDSQHDYSLYRRRTREYKIKRISLYPVIKMDRILKII